MLGHTLFKNVTWNTKKFFVVAGLLGDFSCLIMDEPSNAIDRHSIETIIGYLRLFSENKLIIIATHDQHLQSQLPGKIFDLSNQIQS